MCALRLLQKQRVSNDGSAQEVWAVVVRAGLAGVGSRLAVGDAKGLDEKAKELFHD